jgi:dTDP-4-amino-4,6-dideoxygalactose transaminase
VVFDAAHAYGAEHKGRKVGSQRDNAVFSLSATKLITSAEGGIVAPADNDLSERLRCLRNYGFVGDYNTLWSGLNAKISELNAALGVLSLEMAEETISLRQRLTARYRVNLESIEQLRFQEVLPGNVSTYNYFAIVCASDRDELARKLAAEGIQTKAYFLPVHRHDAYKSFYDRPLPQTEKLYAEILCLPLFNELPLKTVDWICEVVADHFQA